MFVIVGLGNPSREYKGTRHNAGFEVIDRISEKYNISVNIKKHRALIGKGMIQGKKVILAKPQTFMNLSGESVRSLVNFYQVDVTKELVVVYDDVSLGTGQLRIRAKGSAGGHNGIKNIISQIGGQVFPRIKVGVGEKPPKMDLADSYRNRRKAGTYGSGRLCAWAFFKGREAADGRRLRDGSLRGRDDHGGQD